MARRERLTPSLFDQLVADHNTANQDRTDPKDRKAAKGAATPAKGDEVGQSSPFARYEIPKISTFNINDLRVSIKRELDHLLNVTAFESVVDLTPYPEVRKSVLNYGLPDIAGRTYSRSAKVQRQKDLMRVIADFEPRLSHVQIEWDIYSTDPGEITFTIRGDITDAAGSMQVRYKTKLEIDTAAFMGED